MSYSLSPLLKPRFFVNATNKPLVGGKLYTYLAETTTPATTYSNDTGTPNTNPIILDANGECNLYLDDDKVYRLILKDANDVTYFDKDRISSIGGGDYKVLTFNTIDDLRLKIGSEKEPTAQTSGYYAAGDGGGNSFYWDGTSGATDNGGTVIKPTFVSGVGRWLAIDAYTINVRKFGAMGDGVTDDTEAIQKAIDFAFANSVRRILFESNHLVTDLNLTKLYYCGLILEGLNTTHQPSAATLIVTGANSQGIDISGTNGLIFRNITIRGNASAAPRCAIFASRVVGSQESAAHVFDRLSIYGTFTKAAIYNFAGELWSLNSLRVNISGACHGGYFTSYNSLGLTSKFQTPNTAVTPMTGTTLSNPYIQVSGSGIAGLWFEQDPGSPPDATLQGVYISNGYFTSRGGADCSIKLTEVLGNVFIESIIDESFSTGDTTACSTIIKHTGARVLRGLAIKDSVFYGRTNVISANSVQDYTAEGNYVWNPNISWVFSTLNSAYHKTLFENELFSVSAGANINVVPSNRNSAANISIPITRTNQGYDNKYRGSPLNNVNPERRDISMLDSLHNRLFTAVGTGSAVDSTSWREVVTKQLATAIPTSGNYAAGQLVFNNAPNTSTNRALGFLATTAGTMGTLGAITATTTASSSSVTFNSATGLSEGAYISIVGVTGTKQIVTLSGLNATLDSACDASVTGASVSFVPATFYRVGPLNILSAASSQTVSLAAGATTSFTVTVTGAEMGDFAQISYSTASVGSLIVSGSVTATNTVTVSIYNPTGGTINTGTGNWWALVTKR